MYLTVISLVIVLVFLIAAAARCSNSGPNAMLLCPHCQTRGRVRTREVEQKVGISGSKVTGALFTGGFSLLATGLSRKERRTELHCTACEMKWLV